MPLDRTVTEVEVTTAGGRFAVVGPTAAAVGEVLLRLAARIEPGATGVFAGPVPGGAAVGLAGPAGVKFLVLGSPLYRAIADPFAVAARNPVPAWEGNEPPGRTVAQMQAILKAGDGPLLLGAAQAVLDGSAVRLDTPEQVRGVWELLPTRTRAELWPAAVACHPDGFHLSVGPPAAGCLTADQCRDYPEGRYELALQTAVEAGDQLELDRLFARRTSRETLHLAAGLVAVAVGGAVVAKLLG
jgi:hypothetical protein